MSTAAFLRVFQVLPVDHQVLGTRWGHRIHCEPSCSQAQGEKGLPHAWGPPVCSPLQPESLQRPSQPSHALTFPAGGRALWGTQLLPVVIPAPPRGLWSRRHHTVRPVGRESVWLPDREGLCWFRREHFRCPAVRVCLLLVPLFLFSLLLAPPFWYQLAVEGLP